MQLIAQRGSHSMVADFFFFVIAIYTGSHKSGNMSPVSQTVQKCETWSIPAYSNAIIILIMILSKLESCWVSYEKNIMKIHVQTCCYWWIIKRLFQHANRCKGLSHTLTMFLKSFFWSLRFCLLWFSSNMLMRVFFSQ